jgi:hypothetical protein
MRTILTLTLAAVSAASALAQNCSVFAATSQGANIGAGDDTFRQVGLPFPFPFNGTTYTSMFIGSNGYITFVSGDTTYSESEALMLAGAPRIALCWDDWYAPGATAGNGIFYAVTNTSAHVTWKNVPHFGVATNFANMEVVLSVGGEIDFYYDATMNVPQSQCIVGLSAGNNAAAAQMSFTPLPATMNGTNYQVFTAPTSAGQFNLAGSKIMMIPTGPTTYAVTSVSPSTCPPTNYPSIFSTVPTAYGAGCPAPQPTGGNVYELFPSTLCDLSNTSLQFIALGPNQYLALSGPGFDNSFTPADIVAGQGDDTQVTVAVGPMGSFPFHGTAVTSIAAGSNGYLWMAPNLSNAYIPTAADFASNSPRIAPLMHDWNFNAGGTFYWTTTPTSCMATWQNVGAFGVVGAQNTFQVKLSANGDITFNYGTVLNNGSTGGTALTGISFGNSPTNAGVDMSSFLTSPTVIDLTLILPLAHAAATNAALGTQYTVNMSNVPSGAGFGAFVFGVNQLSIDLTFLGMTGCTQYTSLDFSTLLPLSGPTAQFSLNVPFNGNFAGINLFSQAAVFAPLNPFGVIASNGMAATLGL